MNLTIEPLRDQDLEEFFSYLEVHLKESGVNGTPLFMPQSRSQSGLRQEVRAAFADGLGIHVGEPKWRRAWVYRDVSERIAGHVDLRARPEANTGHRALLGMGIDRPLRGKGIGRALLEHALQWAKATSLIEVIDLDVLEQNEPALKLYRKAGFEMIGRIDDMFRIDGQPEAYVMMAKRL